VVGSDDSQSATAAATWAVAEAACRDFPLRLVQVIPGQANQAAMDEARLRDASVLIVIDGSAAGLVSNSSAKSLFGVGGNQYHPGVSFSMAPCGAKIPCYEIN